MPIPQGPLTHRVTLWSPDILAHIPQENPQIISLGAYIEWLIELFIFPSEDVERALLWNSNDSSLERQGQISLHTLEGNGLWGEFRLYISLEFSVLGLLFNCSLTKIASSLCSESPDHAETWEYSWSIESWHYLDRSHSFSCPPSLNPFFPSHVPLGE